MILSTVNPEIIKEMITKLNSKPIERKEMVEQLVKSALDSKFHYSAPWPTKKEYDDHKKMAVKYYEKKTDLEIQNIFAINFC